MYCRIFQRSIPTRHFPETSAHKDCHPCMYIWICVNFLCNDSHLFPQVHRPPAEGCPSMHASMHVYMDRCRTFLQFSYVVTQVHRPPAEECPSMQASMHVYMDICVICVCNFSQLFLQVHRLPAEGCPSMHACIICMHAYMHGNVRPLWNSCLPFLGTFFFLKNQLNIL